MQAPGNKTLTMSNETIGRARQQTGPKPNPILPLGGPFRRWHLTPWKTTEATALMDDMNGLGEDEETDDTESTTTRDIINNLVTQAGSVFGSRNGMIVPRPRPGQMVPGGSPGTVLGMSTQTLMLVAAAGLGVLLLAKKK